MYNNDLDTIDYIINADSNNCLYKDCYIRKHGYTVQIELNGLKNLIPQTYNLVINGLPESMIPARDVTFSLSFINENYRFNIRADGKLYCYPYDTLSAQDNLVYTLCYVI